jgi:LysR family hydrogen peroxide-inducible transcriptional activator
LTLTQLKYALELSATGNYKLAAKQLSISQPALSIQIQNLEEEIGISIFDRNQMPIKPTEEGTEFLNRAQEIIRQSDALVHFADELEQNIRGSLKIGVIPTVAPFLVPLFAEKLQEDHPDLRLDIQEDITEKVIAGIREGKYDVGIVSTPVHARNIACEPLFYERFYFYFSDKPPNIIHSTEELDLSEIWMLEEGNCFRDQVGDFCDLSELRQDRQFIYRTNSIDALIKIVEGKGGFTILPELCTLTLTAEQEENIMEISSVRQKAREIGLITAAHHGKQRLIDHLGLAIRDNIPKHMLQKSEFEVLDPMIQL